MRNLARLLVTFAAAPLLNAAAPEATAPIVPFTAIGAGGAADEGSEIPLEIEGTLVSRSPSEVVVKDGTGNQHRFRTSEQTRYVWTEAANPKHFGPGAPVRAVYFTVGQEQLATAIWVLGAAPR